MRRSPEFRQRLEQGVILCDGAMGTYLHNRGVPLDRSFPELVLRQPDLIEGIHRAYADAGAEILESNTYAANRLQLERHGLGDQVQRINVHAVRLTRQASEGRCYVAGAVGPLGVALAPLGALAPERAAEIYREQIEALVSGGVDLIMIETISDLEEFNVALEAARAVTDLPIVIHKTFTEDGRTLVGELPHEVVARAEARGADVVGANCTVGPQRMVDIIERMALRASIPLSAMPTAGLPRLVDGRVDYHAEPTYMARYARLMAEAGARLVGACCGSTPEHIGAMRAELDARAVEVRRRSILIEAPEAEAREPTPARERSRIGADLGRRFLALVDLQLPRTHDLTATLEHARALRAAGARNFLLSDALRARLFVHPLVVAHRLQGELGVECVLPLATRDKNVLGIQSDLLAAHVLEVNNVLVSPADPANFGDYPTATTLSDLSVAGLVRILDSMNRGLDLAANPIGEPTSFVTLVAGDPHASDLAAEIERIRIQVDHGALAVVTPPCFDVEGLDRFLEALDGGVPVVVGLLPLRSAAHADYLHHEVPGIRIPLAVRTRLGAAKDPELEGVAVARRILEELPARVAGVHLVPPYRKPERARAIVDDLGLEAVSGMALTASS